MGGGGIFSIIFCEQKKGIEKSKNKEHELRVRTTIVKKIGSPRGNRVKRVRKQCGEPDKGGHLGDFQRAPPMVARVDTGGVP